MKLPLTFFTLVANKSVWAIAFKAVLLVNTRSIVEARITVAFTDICDKRNRVNEVTFVRGINVRKNIYELFVGTNELSIISV